MPSPRLDSSLTEYSFTEQEAIEAKIFTPLQLMYMQTLYSLTFKQKASSLIPEGSMDDRAFLLRLGALEGKLDVLQQLIIDSKLAQEAKIAASLQKNPLASSEVNSSLVEIKELSERASSQVHNS